jgi:hypothetical protein
MVRTLLAGDQADELGQHSRQSRTGDRYHGCRGVGRGGCERHAAHLRWLPPGPSRDGSARRRNLLEQSYGCRDHGDRPHTRSHIRRCEAVPDRQSAFGLRAVPGAAVFVVVAQTVEIALAFAVAFAQAIELALALAFDVIVSITVIIAIRVGDRLRPAT